MLQASSASAQLFGQRSMGRPFVPRSPYSREVELGTLEQNERFIRGNRRTSDFVGTDRSEARRFVGNQQAGSRANLQSAARGVREQRSQVSPINAPRPPLGANEPYDPKLHVAFGFSPPPESWLSDQLVGRLTRSLNLPQGQIEVSVAERVATLRGVVASVRVREMAELLAKFEPGISQVQNQLTVAPQDLLPKPK